MLVTKVKSSTKKAMLVTKVKSSTKKANNRITKWLALNDPTEILDLSKMNLTELPPIPLHCLNFYCNNNKLTFLPELPNCQILICSSNLLTSLPPLPNCTALYCERNQLTCLPELHNCFRLTCNDNKLTCLPDLPMCRSLFCKKNQLTYLPQLPASYIYINCKENKYLHVSKSQAKKFNLRETPDYTKCARVIQRSYKRYLRKRYRDVIDKFLFVNLTKIICLYAI